MPGAWSIETAGVGYEVSDPARDLLRMPGVGAPVSLEIRQVVREDSITSMVSPRPPRSKPSTS